MIYRILIALLFLTTFPAFAEESSVSDNANPAPQTTDREPTGIKPPEEPMSVGGGYQMPEQDEERGDSGDYSYSSED